MNLLKAAFWSIKQLYKAAPFELLVVSLFILVQGLIPALSLFAIQGIINWVNAAIAFPIFFVFLWGVMLMVEMVMSPIFSIFRLQLNEKILEHCNLLLMEKANAIYSLEPFENPKFYDEIQFLKTESSRRPLNFVYVLTGFVKDCITLLSIFGVLFSIAWWIPLTMFIAGIPHAMSTLWFEKQAWDQMLFRSPDARKMGWLSSLTLDSKIAKEIRLFGIGKFLTAKYKEILKNNQQSSSKERWKKSKLFAFLSSLTVIGNIAILSLVLLLAKEGALQVGGLVVAIQALIMTQTQLANCVANMGMFAPALLFFCRLRSFLANQFYFENGKKLLKLDSIKKIQFKNVSFRYQDGREALLDVSFTINEGEKIAIVGENGAGKSTLIKLLLRFYEPSEGVITVNDHNLIDLDFTEWRSQISGVFQDFGQYHFSVKENIVLSHLSQSFDEEHIYKAAQKGGFFPILELLPSDLNSLLGKEFGGTSLSGGEWQRLAMSRAFFKKAELLILDEPTASLDPEQEQETFKRFAEQSEKRTTLLITHRLGSIKIADRILVLKKGQLIEQGTHDELLKKDGEYAYLFKIQADQYSFNI